jgi:hypothetical protein
MRGYLFRESKVLTLPKNQVRPPLFSIRFLCEATRKYMVFYSEVKIKFVRKKIVRGKEWIRLIS